LASGLVRPGIIAQGPQIFRRRVTRHLAAGAHDEAGSGVAVAGRQRRRDRRRRAVAQTGNRVEVAQQNLIGVRLARLSNLVTLYKVLGGGTGE